MERKEGKVRKGRYRQEESGYLGIDSPDALIDKA